MKTLAACVLLAAVGLALAGCGSTRSLAFTSPTKVTLATAETGARVVCRNDRMSTTGTVPAPGVRHGWTANWGGNDPSLVLIRRRPGALFVACS